MLLVEVMPSHGVLRSWEMQRDTEELLQTISDEYMENGRSSRSPRQFMTRYVMVD